MFLEMYGHMYRFAYVWVNFGHSSLSLKGSLTHFFFFLTSKVILIEKHVSLLMSQPKFYIGVIL